MSWYIPFTKAEAVDELTRLIQDGSTLWANKVKISKNRKRCHIKYYIISDNELHDVTVIIAYILGLELNKKTQGIEISHNWNASTNLLCGLGTLNGIDFMTFGQSCRLF